MELQSKKHQDAVDGKNKEMAAEKEREKQQRLEALTRIVKQNILNRRKKAEQEQDVKHRKL